MSQTMRGDFTSTTTCSNQGHSSNPRLQLTIKGEYMDRIDKVREKYRFHSLSEPCKCDGCFLLGEVDKFKVVLEDWLLAIDTPEAWAECRDNAKKALGIDSLCEIKR